MIDVSESFVFHVHQEDFKGGVVRRRSQRKSVTRQNTFSDGDWTDSSLSPSSRPFFSAVQSPSSSFPQASAAPSLSGESLVRGENLSTHCLFQSLKTVTAQLQQPLIPQNVQVTLEFQTLLANIKRTYCSFQAQEVKKKS